MGAGMTCYACHNSRAGEHTDFATATTIPAGVPTLTSMSGPHASAQGDVVEGFNAYFVERFSPSPHLAVADTCAGCHYAVPTAADVSLKETTNHSFKVDSTICANCHSANVDGIGLQAAYSANEDAVRGLFTSKLMSPLNAAITAGTVNIRAWQLNPNPALAPVNSSASSSNLTVVIPQGNLVTGIDWVQMVDPTAPALQGAISVGLNLHLTTAIAGIQFVDGTGANVGAPQALSNIVVAISSVKTGVAPAGTGGTVVWQNPVFMPAANAQIAFKSYWNLALLKNDNSYGIHNPGFYDAVLTATTGQLKTLP